MQLTIDSTQPDRAMTVERNRPTMQLPALKTEGVVRRGWRKEEAEVVEVEGRQTSREEEVEVLGYYIPV